MSKIFSRRRLATAILLTVVFYICMATSFDPSDRYSHMQNPLVTLLIYLLYVTAFCTIDIRDCMILSRFSNPQAAIRYYIGKTAGYVSACFAVDFVVLALLSLLLRDRSSLIQYLSYFAFTWISLLYLISLYYILSGLFSHLWAKIIVYSGIVASFGFNFAGFYVVDLLFYNMTNGYTLFTFLLQLTVTAAYWFLAYCLYAIRRKKWEWT